jgi:hypothetical protein
MDKEEKTESKQVIKLRREESIPTQGSNQGIDERIKYNPNQNKEPAIKGIRYNERILVDTI